MSWELLSSVPPDELRQVIAIARRRTFAGGEVVFQEGDAADALHLIDTGRFAVRVTTPLGDVATLSVRGPGEAFGELALVAEGVRSATVAALEPGATHAVSRADFDRLRREHPDVDRVLVTLLAEQVRRLSTLVADAYYASAEKRVLRRLLELAAVYEGAEIPLTQEHLAELAGTSRATVNGVLREEHARGALALSRGRMTVLDVAGLATRAR